MMNKVLLLTALAFISSPVLADKEVTKEGTTAEYTVGSRTAPDFEITEFTPKFNPNISCVVAATYRIREVAVSCYPKALKK